MKTKESDANDGDAWKFGGKLGDFERFDKMVLRRCRKRLGAMGEDFWYNSLPDFESMTTDYEWNEYCEAVLDVIKEQDSTRAKYLRSEKGSTITGFWELEWHIKWRKREYSLLFDYVESILEGEAEMELTASCTRDKARLVRKIFFKQFGLGSSSDIHQMEMEYAAGMPAKGQPAFPANCDMRKKLRQLSNQRLVF